MVLIDKRQFDYALPLGADAPAFSLSNVDGNSISLDECARPALAIIFWCNHCPYAKKAQAELIRIAKEHGHHADVLAINSNDAEQYPEDSFEEMQVQAEKSGYLFPYLYDETQEVAKAYGAECTPHAFVFDKERKLRYQGNVEGLSDAIAAIADGKEPAVPLTSAMGCSIKWRR